MHPSATRLPRTRLVLAWLAAVAISSAPVAHGAVTSYHANLDGPSESPPVASPGIGTGQVDVDPVAHTMRVRANFTGLIGTTTASHIHGPTAVAGSGTASVMTTTPSFVGFPLGVTFGTCDFTMDMTLASSYRPGFLSGFGGDTALAEAALFQAIADGKAYLNIHTTFAGGGEIRGFLQVFDPVPVDRTSWGRVKKLYR